MGFPRNWNIDEQQLIAFIYSADILHWRTLHYWKSNPRWFRCQCSLSVLRLQLLVRIIPTSRRLHLTRSQAHPTFEQATGSSRRNFLHLRILHCSCLAQAFSRNWRMTIGFRFLLRIGLGLESATIPIYASERAPAKVRGALVMFWQFFTASGIMLGYRCGAIFRGALDGTNGALCRQPDFP